MPLADSSNALCRKRAEALRARKAARESTRPRPAWYGLFDPFKIAPLRCVISSPAFRRRHHSWEEKAAEKNFAGLLPLWDLLFAPFYMPKESRPTVFGVAGDPVPDGFVRQRAYPFAARRKART